MYLTSIWYIEKNSYLTYDMTTKPRKAKKSPKIADKECVESLLNT